MECASRHLQRLSTSFSTLSQSEIPSPAAVPSMEAQIRYSLLCSMHSSEQERTENLDQEASIFFSQSFSQQSTYDHCCEDRAHGYMYRKGIVLCSSALENATGNLSSSSSMLQEGYLATSPISRPSSPYFLAPRTRQSFFCHAEEMLQPIQSVVLLFNLGLAYHMMAAHRAFQTSCHEHLEKSLRLYELAWDFVNHLPTCPRSRGLVRVLQVVIPNNMGQIHYELGFYKFSRHMFQHSLTGMSQGTGDRGEDFDGEDWAGLVFNTMVLHEEVLSAGAA